MKLRRYISLTLLAVYLFAAGGAAYATLSCECVAMKSRVVRSCCHQTVHSGNAVQDGMHTSCCENHHSTEIELYTGSGSENDRGVRCAVTLLPPQLTPEFLQGVDPLITGVTHTEPPCFCSTEGYRLSAGLRAPPVLV